MNKKIYKKNLSPERGTWESNFVIPQEFKKTLRKKKNDNTHSKLNKHVLNNRKLDDLSLDLNRLNQYGTRVADHEGRRDL